MLQKLIAENSFLIAELITHIQRINPEDYKMKHRSISNSSIGEHIRHIINFFEAFLKSFDEDKINYDIRIRNPRIELEKDFAIEKLKEITEQFNSLTLDGNNPLLLETSAGNIYSNLSRELHYINEHTIHHTAIIRIIFLQFFPQYEVDSSFGFSSSTLVFLKTKLVMAMNN
jgi:uncharacterized damage-inducible protein DinB